MKNSKKICLALIIIMCMSLTVPINADNKGKKNDQSTEITGITIDGYYDDWEDKPMSRITWNNNNGKANHDVSLIKDEDYIYIYIRMHPSYQSPIPIDAINLFVNDKLCQLFVRYANDQNTTDWSHYVDLSKNGIYLGLHPFTYYPNTSLGDAAITVDNGYPNDTMEIRISIEALEKVMGLSEGTINNGSKIELQLPNVGGGSVQLLGTSTGSVVGIIICIGIVGLIKWRRDKKMRLA